MTGLVIYSIIMLTVLNTMVAFMAKDSAYSIGIKAWNTRRGRILMLVPPFALAVIFRWWFKLMYKLMADYFNEPK